MSSRRLPPRPNLEHLRKEARHLLQAHRRKDPAACAALRRLPRLAGQTDAGIFAAPVALADVQHALAMEYGFDSWAALRHRVANAAPPILANPPARWYHGSPEKLTLLRAGSTVTPVRELAAAFAHKPSRVDIRINENDETNRRTSTIAHDGRRAGCLYEVFVEEPLLDLRPLPGSTMAPGEEMQTTRELPVVELSRLEVVPEPPRTLVEPLRQDNPPPLPPHEIVVYDNDAPPPPEAEELFREELAHSRKAPCQPGQEEQGWRFALVCAVTPEGHVLGGVHFDMGPVNAGPLAWIKAGILEQVLVRPEYRRLGLGAALLTRAIEAARAAGCQHMRCNANWKNPAEIALYMKCGFAMTDITDGDAGGEYFVVRPL